MGNRAVHHFRATISRLQRNPVLTAMMVYSLVFGMTALTATIAVWRASSNCATSHTTLVPYVVHVAEDMGRRGDFSSPVRVLRGI
jgi:cell division protein FtsX